MSTSKPGPVATNIAQRIAPSTTPTTENGAAPSHKHALLEAIAGRYRIVPVLVMLVLIWVFFDARTATFSGTVI